MTPDEQAMASLLVWLRDPLGNARQRQVVISQQRSRASVTLRFGEQYAITITRLTLADAATAALAAADRESWE